MDTAAALRTNAAICANAMVRKNAATISMKPPVTMKPKLIWSAQLALVGLCALALKFYYSTATADQLRWILAPTTKMVELLSGRRFEFELYAGYMTSDRTFVIAVPCAGVNFLITAFLMLALRRLWRARFQALSWRFIPITAMFAYVVTLIANTIRICIALELRARSVEISGLTNNQLHRLEGIVVYFGFLLFLFFLTEEFESTKPSRLARVLPFPLLIYYATTLGVPLLNGSFKRGAFWEHAIFVLVLPLLLVLPVLLAALGLSLSSLGPSLSLLTRLEEDQPGTGDRHVACSVSVGP
ncbi:MAG TPA: exosortase K [Pyrinomonadaceae bacterium]